MPKITITEELAEQLFNEEYEGTDYELVEIEPWEDDGKYSLTRVIFKHNGKIYACQVNRTGSYYTDYYYSFYTDCNEVIQKEITTTSWVDVE